MVHRFGHPTACQQVLGAGRPANRSRRYRSTPRSGVQSLRQRQPSCGKRSRQYPASAHLLGHQGLRIAGADPDRPRRRRPCAALATLHALDGPARATLLGLAGAAFPRQTIHGEKYSSYPASYTTSPKTATSDTPTLFNTKVFDAAAPPAIENRTVQRWSLPAGSTLLRRDRDTDQLPAERTIPQSREHRDQHPRTPTLEYAGSRPSRRRMAHSVPLSGFTASRTTMRAPLHVNMRARIFAPGLRVATPTNTARTQEPWRSTYALSCCRPRKKQPTDNTSTAPADDGR